METLIKFYDEAEDLVLTTVIRLRRSLSLLPRERRRRPRLNDLPAEPTSVAAR